MKRRGSKSLKRAAACSEKAAKEHIGELAEELIARGIMEDAVKVESGVWTGRIDARRIMNNDETPQFIDYDVDLTYLTYGGCKVRESIAVRHKHLLVISPPISFTHSRPVSFLRVSINVILGPPCLLCPCFGSHRTRLCPTSSGCLSRCPASLILLCWILVVTRCSWS